jgi:hypothetical protein
LDSISALLRWLETTRLSVFIQQSEWAFPMIEAIHVIALALVVGTIAIVDLRLLGWASVTRPVSGLCREVLPLTWGAFALAVITGALMFISRAADYYGNLAFRLKLLVLVAAGLNMLLFQLVTYRGRARWDGEPTPPLPARLAGAMSLTCWVGIVFFGRWIGFTMSPS